MLFCLRCSNGDATLQQRDELLQQQEMCCALRISPAELEETKELFIKKNFINEDWTPKNWGKRQYQSDNSTPRSQKSRARHHHDSKEENPFKSPPAPPPVLNRTRNGDATLQQRRGNGDATPPDTDTDTDIKKSREHTTVRTGTGSAEKPNGSVSVRFPYLADESFKPFVVAACALWPDLIDEDLQSSWQFTWKKWDFEQKALCVKKTQARLDAGEDGQFVKRPPGYLESGDWKRPPRKRDGSTDVATRTGREVRESATERAIRIGYERIRKEGRL
jgi:hypothetical protein